MTAKNFSACMKRVLAYEGGIQPIARWRQEIRRLWSVRVAVFLAFLNGAVLGLAAFVDVVNPWTFLILNVVGYVLIAVVRLLKQAKPK